MMETLSTTTTSDSKKKVDSVSATECANCGTTTTPLWRRGPNGETICNACGLYLKARNTLRPPTLKRTLHKKTPTVTTNTNDCGGGTCPGGGQCNGTGGSTSCAGCPAFNQHQVNRQALICANCRTTTTPLWRRDEQGNTICNACGLYYKLHNVHRPVSMKRSVIKRRKRIIVAQGSDEEEIEEEEEEEPPTAIKQVPEIEDYVVLKKKKMELPKKKQHHYLLSPNHNTPLSDKIPPPPLFTKPQLDTQQQKSFLPPISSERQSYRLESLFGRRDSNSSSSSLPSTLPPLALPPLTPPSSQSQHYVSPQQSYVSPQQSYISPQHQYQSPQQQYQSPQQQYQSPQQHSNLNQMSPPPIQLATPKQPSPTPPPPGKYELADFDQALDRLEHLRRQVRPEQAYALSQLTQSLTDLASKAEAILSLDSLAYGR
jgi:GATA-binding protein